MHRHMGKQEINDIIKLIADTPLQQLFLTLNPDFSCTNNLPFTTRNKYIANNVSCLRTSAISYVLNADSGR